MSELWTKELQDEVKRIETLNALELFGRNEKRARILYKSMQIKFHPDKFEHAGLDKKAAAVFKEVEKKWSLWQNEMGVETPKTKAANKSSSKTAGVIQVGSDVYKIMSCISESETIKIFQVQTDNLALCASGCAYLIVSRDVNQQLNIENMKNITVKAGKYADYFPELLKSDFKVPQRSGKHSAVLMYIEGFWTFRSLGAFQRMGEHILHPKDIAWIWRRILSIGAVYKDCSTPWVFDPFYEFIQPDAHVNFSLSPLYPVAYTAKHNPVSEAAKVMLSLMQENAPLKLKNHFKVVANGVGSDVHPAQILLDFDYIIGQLWGERKFHAFVYPKEYV